MSTASIASTPKLKWFGFCAPADPKRPYHFVQRKTAEDALAAAHNSLIREVVIRPVSKPTKEWVRYRIALVNDRLKTQRVESFRKQMRAEIRMLKGLLK